jgi:hypothetical protein
MNPADSPDILKLIGQYGLPGLICYLLGRRFLSTSDEDRKWIRDHGERAVLQNEQIVTALKDVVGIVKTFGETLTQIVETNKEVVATNRLVVETNAKLVTLLEKKG